MSTYHKTVRVHRINWNMGYAAMPELKKPEGTTDRVLQGGLPPRERLGCDKLARESKGYEVRDRPDHFENTDAAKGRGWNTECHRGFFVNVKG